MAYTIQSYRDLIAWQKGIDFVLMVYKMVETFPKSEMYSLTNQLKRAAYSIPLNIAEGRGRRSTKTFLHFLDISYGSLAEVETGVEIALRLGYLNPSQSKQLNELSSEIGRILNGLIASLEKQLDSP